MKNKKFIFVTGPSESGKSGGINYIIDNYGDEIKHLKIRNVFPEVYKESNTDLDFQEWYDYEYQNNFESFWDRYIKKVYSLLGNNLGVLYIDADFDKRIFREYTRLRTDSTRSSRKADLTVTLEDVTKKTIEKDSSKQKKETFEYRDLVYRNDCIEVGDRDTEEPFSFLIENNGSESEFHEMLDDYVVNVLLKDKEKRLVK